MNKVLQKKSIQFGLVLLVIAIWGYNMFKIVDISDESDSRNKNEEITFKKAFFKLPESQKYQFKADFDDPFEPGLHTKERDNKSKEASKPQPVKLPDIKLSGVIEGTALIQNNNQIIFFAAVGDTVEKARVILITADSVVMKKKTKKFTIRIQ